MYDWNPGKSKIDDENEYVEYFNARKNWKLVKCCIKELEYACQKVCNMKYF